MVIRGQTTKQSIGAGNSGMYVHHLSVDFPEIMDGPVISQARLLDWQQEGIPGRLARRLRILRLSSCLMWGIIPVWAFIDLGYW